MQLLRLELLTFVSSTLLVGVVLAKKDIQMSLPSYVGKGCSRNDPKIDECVVRVGAPAISKVAQGDPKYRIPKLDPLLVKEIRVQQGTKAVGLQLTCTDCQLYGLHNTKFIKSRVDWKKRTFDWDLNLDKLKVEGKYNVSGKVLLLPISGSGDLKLNLNDIKFHFMFNWNYETRDGLKFVKFENSTLPFEVGSLTIHLENLFNGDKLLGENMNTFLNENWRELLKDLKPALSKTLANLFSTILQNMANIMPFDVMFPEKYPL